MAANTTFNTVALNQAIMDFVTGPAQGYQLVVGSFEGNATNPITQTTIRGAFTASVTRTGVGVYRVQLALPLPNNLSVYAPPGLYAEAQAWIASESINLPPTAGLVGNCSAFDTTTNKNTFVIYTYVGATATDAAATDRVFFQLGWKNTAVQP